jgi:hypothetical protein
MHWPPPVGIIDDMTDTPTHQKRLRQKLRRMEHDDSREALKGTSEAMEQHLRTTLNERQPGAAPEEIERLVGLVMSKGARPTTSVLKSAPGIPQQVIDARRAERKRTVAAGRNRRRD